MKDIRICMLEVSPRGPLSHRTEDIDFFFVTHDEFNKDAISFNKGFKWAQNRNFLAENLPIGYDYYWFTDYDVSYESNTSLSVVEQIKKDLLEYNPLVMVCYSNNKGYPEKLEENVIPFLFTNNHMKIVHKSVIDWFFPMPTKYGSIWDTCHYFNVMEVPFEGKVLLTYNVNATGLVSEDRSQGNKESMTILNNDMIKCFKNIPTYTHQMLKEHYQNKKSKVEKSDIPINEIVKYFFDIDKLGKFKNNDM